MEVYLRITLLAVAALIIGYILFDILQHRRRRKRLAHTEPVMFTNSSHAADMDLDAQDPSLPPLTQPMASAPGVMQISRIDAYKRARSKIENSAPKNSVPPSAAVPSPVKSAAKLKPVSQVLDNPLIVISVVAKQHQQFSSYDLLQAISATGMEFGKMNIFHRYLPTAQGNEVLFSLASTTEPGDFDLDNMGNFTCKGLSLFMDIRRVQDPMFAFEEMLEAAKQLAEDLDGELREGQTMPWSSNCVEKYINRITKFQTNTVQ